MASFVCRSCRQGISPVLGLLGGCDTFHGLDLEAMPSEEAEENGVALDPILASALSPEGPKPSQESQAPASKRAVPGPLPQL